MERAELARLLGVEWSRERQSPEAIAVEALVPTDFQAQFVRAVAGTGPVFLVDPLWGSFERDRLAQLMREAPSEGSARGWLCIPSGGTSGALKFARHDAETISAAVKGFSQHFAIERVNALGLLPLHHVSGLMAWLRCALTGGRYVPGNWKELAAGQHPPLATTESWVISLVPTQLQRLLKSPSATEWLRGFKVILVGGGPVWPELADAAAKAQLPISLSYGMTETAAMVCALTPDEFRSGARSSGRALPHTRVAITPNGLVSIEGGSLFRGYWPERRSKLNFETADLGRIDERGHLHVIGRADAMIITGGKKVSPAEVELALRATGEFADIAVIGLPDREWGEVVIACYPEGAEDSRPNFERVNFALRELPGFKQPKRFFAVKNWPRNAQGKLNREQLRKTVQGA